MARHGRRYKRLTPRERLDVRAEVPELGLADAIGAVFRHAPSALPDDKDLEAARDREIGGAVAPPPRAGGAAPREEHSPAPPGGGAPRGGESERRGGPGG